MKSASSNLPKTLSWLPIMVLLNSCKSCPLLHMKTTSFSSRLRQKCSSSDAFFGLKKGSERERIEKSRFVLHKVKLPRNGQNSTLIAPIRYSDLIHIKPRSTR